MFISSENLSSQKAVQRKLEWFYDALRDEHKRLSGSFHLLSDDCALVESLYRVAAILTKAQSDTARLIASRAMGDEALTVLTEFTELVRKQISDEWRGGNFRAAEGLSRMVPLIKATHEDIAVWRDSV